MITMTKDMAVGVAKIDAQHKELIDRLNKVIAMGAGAVSKDEAEKTLAFLSDYIIKHFGDEEVLQKQSGYPKYEWHKAQHQLYIGEVSKLRHEFRANGPSAKFILDLNHSIVGWIVRHIKSVDVEFGKFYNAKA